MKNEGTPTGDEYFPNIWDWESELFKIFQMSFSNRMLFMNIGHLSCSPDPTANSKTTNPNFHKFFDQFTPGPQLMRNSTSARFQKSPKIHLVRPIIHLVRIFALSTS